MHSLGLDSGWGIVEEFKGMAWEVVRGSDTALLRGLFWNY